MNTSLLPKAVKEIADARTAKMFLNPLANTPEFLLPVRKTTPVMRKYQGFIFVTDVRYMRLF